MLKGVKYSICQKYNFRDHKEREKVTAYDSKGFPKTICCSLQSRSMCGNCLAIVVSNDRVNGVEKIIA